MLKLSTSYEAIDDLHVRLDDPQVPAGVREAVSAQWHEGAPLWRCPRPSKREGLFNLGTSSTVIEWWLLDKRGELMEVFWES